MKKFTIALVSCLVLAACSQSTSQMDTSDQAVQETQEAVDTVQNTVDTDAVTTLTLTDQNDSGQTGTATISKVSETQTKVVLALEGGTYTQPQPAHIHLGTCEKPGEVVYPLTNVVDGMSETTLTARYEDVIDPQNAEYILNVHESAAKSNVYTACVEWDD